MKYIPQDMENLIKRILEERGLPDTVEGIAHQMLSRAIDKIKCPRSHGESAILGGWVTKYDDEDTDGEGEGRPLVTFNQEIYKSFLAEHAKTFEKGTISSIFYYISCTGNTRIIIIRLKNGLDFKGLSQRPADHDWSATSLEGEDEIKISITQK